MPRLHETPMGQKFFNLQVPQLLKAVLDLIKTIQDHTKALNANTAALERYNPTEVASQPTTQETDCATANE